MEIFLLLPRITIWSLGFSLISAAMDPPISSAAAAAAAPLFLPQISPIGPPISASMAAFSPGSQVGGQRHRMDSNKKMLVEVIAASTALCGVILFSLAFVWSYYRKSSYKSPEKKTQNSDAERALAFDPPRVSGERRRAPLLDYKLLETATNKFGGRNVIGGGGVGCVYRGKLDDSSQVAVKKLDGGGDDNAEGEFENEVNLLSKLQHLNVISLLGYCVHGDARLTVYGLMQNGSLETQLHGPSNGSALTWHIRMKIALDTARGLEYLHEYCNPPVLHRDLKSSNILLDSDFSAKLSDFGLAVIAGAQNDNGIKPSGTLGYMAPEYILDGRLTDKSDVYAFGVVLLELLLGKKPVEKMAPAQCRSIVTWAMPQLVDRSKLPNIVDPVIRNTMDLKHLYQVAAVAVLCVQPEPSYRPLMTDVLHSLIPLVPMELGGTLRVRQTAP